MSKSESEKKQARVGLASNFIGIAAGTAATAAALRNPALRRPGSSSPGPVTGRALRAASGRQGRVARVLRTPRGRAALIAAGAGGALGLQVANLGGDLVANRVLSRESKIGKSGVDEKKGEAVRKSIEQSVVSKSGTGPVTGHGTSLEKADGKKVAAGSTAGGVLVAAGAAGGAEAWRRSENRKIQRNNVWERGNPAKDPRAGWTEAKPITYRETMSRASKLFRKEDVEKKEKKTKYRGRMVAPTGPGSQYANPGDPELIMTRGGKTLFRRRPVTEVVAHYPSYRGPAGVSAMPVNRASIRQLESQWAAGQRVKRSVSGAEGDHMYVTYGKRDSSKWIQGSEEGKAVQRAVLRDKRRWAYYGGGDAATLGALGLGFGALKANPGIGRKALIGGAIASGIGGLGLGQAANVRDYKVANRAREEYGFPKRSRWAGKQVVGKRYYSAESDRQRRMGAAAGLLGGTAIVTGAAAGRGLVGSRGINPRGDGRVAGASLGYLIPKGASAKKVLRGRAALAATSAVTGVGGVAAYKRGISQRNRSWE